MSRIRIAAALVLVALLGACGEVISSSPASPDPGFTGHWTSSQWGEHYIQIQGDTVRIIYAHDDGRVIGTLRGMTVTGWWTEVPSRQGPSDAGDVTFTLTRGDQSRSIDGSWRYAGDPATHPTRENWDLHWVDDQIPPDIAAKFADRTAFVAHP